ncbi:MAG: electron transfer flavoprotein subunit beta [bacterium]|nr:MAG: electron transfer flavoprotein subunit beta [bacterium]
MKICCLMKQVPDTEVQPGVTHDETDIDRDNIKYVINPYDEFAIQEASRLKQEHPDSEVIVLLLGEEKSKERIRTALAMGCDKGILIKGEDISQLDPITVAQELSEYLKDKDFDIILAGKKAVDHDFGIVGPAVASFLGIPVVTAIHSFDLDIKSRKVICKREGHKGEEVIETLLPAVFTCEKGLNKPKYPSLPSIMKAKKKIIEEIQFSNKPSLSRTLKLTVPKVQREGVIIEGDTEKQVQEVIRLMKEKVKIL